MRMCTSLCDVIKLIYGLYAASGEDTPVQQRSLGQYSSYLVVNISNLSSYSNQR